MHGFGKRKRCPVGCRKRCPKKKTIYIERYIERSPPVLEEKLEKFINNMPSGPPKPPPPPPPPPPPKGRIPPVPRPPPGPRPMTGRPAFLAELEGGVKLKKANQIKREPSGSGGFLNELKEKQSKGLNLKKASPKDKKLEKTYFNPYLKELEAKLKSRIVEFGKRKRARRSKISSEVKYLRKFL